jgi:hypothetical protein
LLPPTGTSGNDVVVTPPPVKEEEKMSTGSVVVLSGRKKKEIMSKVVLGLFATTGKLRRKQIVDAIILVTLGLMQKKSFVSDD